MHRKDSTRWSTKEIRLFIDLKIQEPELASIERYYRMNWPPTHGKNPLRTDLYTLMFNWAGELGRADRWNELHPDKPKPRKIIPLPLIASEPFIPNEEEAAAMARFEEQRKLRKPRSTFDNVKQIMEGNA